MPESEPEKKTVPAGTPDSSGADKRNNEPDRKPSGSSAAPAPAKKQPVPRRAKWAIALLILLCLILLGALVELACLPRFLEKDINRILQPLAEGGGVEFRIKTISLTSAEIACKLTDTTGGTARNVGGIGSFSIRYSPVDFLLDRTVEAIEIENCDVTADYSGGSVRIPAYDLFAKAFQSGEPKEKSDAPAPDDLNAVIPVKIGRISLSGSLSAESRNEDAVDILHIPYAVTVRPDPELGWNKLDCALSVHFATNAVECRAAYLHREKKVVLDLENFMLATSAMPGTVRSALPRGLRAGVSFRSKAELDLNTLKVREDSSVDGSFTVAYRTPQGLRVNSETPFSVKMLPDEVVSLTVGTLKGEYDTIPFEVGGIRASVSLPNRTIKAGLQLTLADSEPAEFSLDGAWNNERTGLTFSLDNAPLLKAAYKGVDVAFRPGKLAAEVGFIDDELTASADFSCGEIRAGFEGALLNPELKGLTAFLRPASITAHVGIDSSTKEASVELTGGELGAGFKGTNVVYRPERIHAGLDSAGEETVLSAGLTGGELTADTGGIKASFRPETLTAELKSCEGAWELSAGLLGKQLLAELEGMSCSADALAFNATSDDGKVYKADAKVSTFKFKQDAAKLTYNAPELGLNAEYSDDILSGEFVCADSALSMPELKLFAKNLHWEFPFDHVFAEDEETENEPAAAEVAENDAADSDSEEEDVQPAPAKKAVRQRTGKVALGDFEFNGVQAASLDGTIQWDAAANALHLKTDAKLFSVTGQIYADVVLGDAGVETVCGITIPEQDADLSKDLAKFLPQFEEISCTGKLGGSAVYKLLPKTTTGNAEFHISDADVLIPEQKLEVRGINLGFEVPEITVLKSAPGQTLSFKSVKYDKIEVGAGRAAFRMEAPDTWQIENALVDWCNGHIRLGSITYRFGQTTTEAVLYCDRLDLPLFLTQIGLGRISGSGSINGTIPVVLVQKTDAFGKSKIDNIYFEDAFLFSTPGEDGVIKGDLDEALTDAGTGIEMELAKDALKDFAYSWVRLRMESTGPDKENLKLSFQVDGRPNRALYYAFDENTASFIKSNTPCIFQGIRLDTNVNMYGKAMELVDYFQQIFSKGELQ